ncbi:MAG TPA: ABC transporter permease subunit [Planctomycetota bacterium]|nr:ABC transporter permease subunit [Planctomycetota bacterium]
MEKSRTALFVWTLVVAAVTVAWVLLGGLVDKLHGWSAFLLVPVHVIGLCGLGALLVFLIALVVSGRPRLAAWVVVIWLAVSTLATVVLVPMTAQWSLPGHFRTRVASVCVLDVFLMAFLAAFLGMGNLWPIIRREVGSLFLSPIAWVVMSAFLVAFGAIFSVSLGYASMAPTFSILPLIMAFVIPMLTMRQIAEERRSGTIELLTTAPVTDMELVVGKFLGALIFFTFILVPTGIYVWILFHFSSVGPDTWMLSAGYLGVLLMGVFMLSFGLFVSSLTREQIVAAVVGAFTLFMLLLLGYLLPPNPPATLATSFWSQVQHALYQLGAFVSLSRHLDPFGRGVVDSREVVFFLSCTAFFLFLAVAMVSTRKWR